MSSTTPGFQTLKQRPLSLANASHKAHVRGSKCTSVAPTIWGEQEAQQGVIREVVNGMSLRIAGGVTRHSSNAETWGKNARHE